MPRPLLFYVAFTLVVPSRGAPVQAPAAGAVPGTGAEVVVAWNARVLEIAEAEDGFLTLKGVRTASMMHVAIHDALQAISPAYMPYAYDGPGQGTPVAVASEAAFAVAVTQYPDRREALESERDRWVASSGEMADSARELGSRAAQAILDLRLGDGWDDEPDYVWRPTGPGVYAEFAEHSGTPAGFVFGAGWPHVRPFLLDSASAFRSRPPPEIPSEAYARAYDEVRRLGARNSEARTADQTHLAMWWKEFVEKSHNRLARERVLADGLTLSQAARLFALLNTSIFDGYVASFEAKLHYNHWRPYTAIRRASTDGNPATEEDPGWTNLHDHTYAFPSYPSAHGTVCAAAMTVMSHVFGATRPFTMTIPEVDSQGPFSPPVRLAPPTRRFDSFMDAAEECALSRVYLGIHFRYDSTAGSELGRRIGRVAVDEFLRAR